MTIKNDILNRINQFENGKVFMSNDFLDLSNNETIRRTLNRLVEEGTIRRVIKGFYYLPAYSILIDEYEAVSVQELAIAIARKYNWNIAPFGNTALNILGLSTQVPTKWVYISSGRYKIYEFENRSLEFKHVKPSEIANMSMLTSTVIQAIRALGINNIDEYAIEAIRNKLTEDEIDLLLIESISTPTWIYNIIKVIGEGNNE